MEKHEPTETNFSDVVETSVSFSPEDENAVSIASSRSPKMKKWAQTVATSTKRGCGKYWSSVFTVATLKQKIPLLTWLPNYRLKCLKNDLIAGVTVGLTVIPQGMAYAALAGLDLQVRCLFQVKKN